MNIKLGKLEVTKSADYNDKIIEALKNAGFILVLDCETATEKYYIVADKEEDKKDEQMAKH